MKKFNIVKLIIAIAIPLLIGGLSAFLTKDAMMVFNTIKKPPLAPPGIAFPIAWTILYILMGISSYLIYNLDEDKLISSQTILKNNILIIYIVQLIFNFFWSIIFFKLSMYKFAFVWLIILWILVFMFIKDAMKLNKVAAYLMIPYLLWMTFAGYLNIMIAVLN
ncbi:MAG: tryptophan-rich sensory protein [Lachnospiraceae bacterium]|nr:tryptophan-rich sensory protein [Lachnospiraceae bacterium]